MPEQHAGYTRIATYLRGRFRPLDGPDETAYAPLFALSSHGVTRNEFAEASELPEAVTKFLIQLDMKIDALLANTRSSALENDFPCTMELSCISANGFDFTSAEPLAAGDWLEAVIPFSDVGTAAGIGRVTARQVTPNGTSIFSFAFSRIQEEEQEKIIRYVFKEERRLLRETRLE